MELTEEWEKCVLYKVHGVMDKKKFHYEQLLSLWEFRYVGINILIQSFILIIMIQIQGFFSGQK